MRRIVIALALVLAANPAFAQYSSPSVVGLARPGQVPATTTNDSACSGCVGEIQRGTLANPGTALGTGATANLITVPLAGGDWNCSASLTLAGAASTVLSTTIAALNSTSATLPTNGVVGRINMQPPSGYTPFATANLSMPIGMTTFQFGPGGGNVYLVENVTFTVSTVNAWGDVICRRAR